MQQSKQLVSEKSAGDYTMPAQDEAGVRLGACGGYDRRFKADGCDVGVGFSTKETRIIGALGPDAVHAKVVESINAEHLHRVSQGNAADIQKIHHVP